MIGTGAGISIEREQPASAARFKRELCDQRFRQFKIKLIR